MSESPLDRYVPPEDGDDAPGQGPGPGRQDHNPFEDDVERSGCMIGLGIVMGLIISFFLPFLMMGLFYERDSNLAYYASLASVFGPAALGVIVLAVPRLRRSAVGLVFGLAIGAIIFAGVCATLLIGTGGW